MSFTFFPCIGRERRSLAAQHSLEQIEEEFNNLNSDIPRDAFKKLTRYLDNMAALYTPKTWEEVTDMHTALDMQRGSFYLLGTRIEKINPSLVDSEKLQKLKEDIIAIGMDLKQMQEDLSSKQYIRCKKNKYHPH